MKISGDKLAKFPKLYIVFAFQPLSVVECRTFDLCTLSHENQLKIFFFADCLVKFGIWLLLYNKTAYLLSLRKETRT